MQKHLNIKIIGEVQGIFFRARAKEKAETLDLYGLARNEPDGSVHLEVEGAESSLSEFIKWCHIGPPSAKIEKVEISESPSQNFSNFKIIY